MATPAVAVDDDKGGGAPVDRVAENFGLILAYLLPGLVGLWAAAYQSPRVSGWIESTAKNSSFGGFLFLMVAAIGAGFTAQTLRWALFEELLPRLCSKDSRAGKKWCIHRPHYDESRTHEPRIQSALAALRDDHYRHYQAHGSLAIALPVVYVSWLVARHSTISFAKAALVGGLVAVITASMFFAALDAMTRMRRKRLELLGEKKG